MTPALALLLACAGTKTVESKPVPNTTPPQNVEASVPAPVKPIKPAPQGKVVSIAGKSRAAVSPAYPARAANMAKRFHDALAGDGNAATSGVSASFALGMLAEGAGASVVPVFEELFGADLASVQIDHARALAAYNDTMGVDLTVVNGVWPDEGATFDQEVLSDLKSTFNADAKPLPFSRNPTEAAASLDAWTRKNTGGLIEKLFPPDAIAGSSLVLANAIAFKGKWKNPFDAEATEEEDFHTPSTVASVPMMHNKKILVPYTEGVSYQAALLPYTGGTTAMAIILPAEGKSLSDVADALAIDNLLALAGANPRYLDLSLPRFKVSSDHDLKANAAALGLEQILGGVSYEKFGGLMVDQALQKVVVEVNEEGTEAAAITAVGMKRSGPPRMLPFHADRPFLFVIWHAETRTPLFIGQIVDPR